MTKNEFIMQAAIRMAGNPEYVNDCHGKHDPSDNLISPELDFREIISDACQLADEIEKALPPAKLGDSCFDDPEDKPVSIQSAMQDISIALDGIHELLNNRGR